MFVGTSNHAKREMERSPPQHRDRLKSGLIGLAYFAKDHRVVGSFGQSTGRGWITGPLVSDIVDDDLHSDLLAAGLKTNDAQHLMNALYSGCDVFVTQDNDLLSRRSDLEKKCSRIRIHRPSEFQAESADLVEELRVGRA